MRKQVNLRHKKMLQTIHKKHGNVSEYYSAMGKKNKGIAKPTSGFGSNTIGADGLTGRERAQAAGRKGGRNRRKFKYEPRTTED